MATTIEDLDKVISQAIRYISKLKKREHEASFKGVESVPAGASSASGGGNLKKLSSENKKLLEERKELRKRVRALIKEIDKVKW